MDLKNYFSLKFELFRIYALRLACKMDVRLVKVGVAKRGVEKIDIAHVQYSILEINTE